MMKTVQYRAMQRVAAVVTAVLIGVACADAATIMYSQWDTGLDGWTSGGSATISNPGGYLSALFPKQIAPTHSSVMIEKVIADGYRPNHISFRFKADEVVPSALRIYVQSSSGRAWFKPINVTTVGEWIQVNADVSFEAGWGLGPSSSKEDFEADMNDVENVSLLIVRNGTSESHGFAVDDFNLDAVPVGGGAPSDSDGDGMSDAWELAYGLNPNSPDDSNVDSDGDGLSNHHEYLAGTDPQDMASTLSLALGQSVDEQQQPVGFVLTWPSAPGIEYQIWKATNLMSGFYMLQGGILATPPVNVYVDEVDVLEHSSFYRIELE